MRKRNDMVRESENILGPDTPKPETMEIAPERQNEFQELVEQTRVLVEQRVGEVISGIDPQFSESERNYQELKNGAGIDDLVELQKIEERVTSFRIRFGNLKKKFKHAVPFLLPIILSAQLMRPETRSEDTSFHNHTVAAEKLKKDGITDERKSAYTPGVSELLYRGITPVGYASVWELIRDSAGNLVGGRDIVKLQRKSVTGERSETIRKKDNTEREDAWRFYLGLPQEHDTFNVSEYKPAGSKVDKYYYSINNWFEKFQKTLSGSDKPDFYPIKQIVEQCTQKERIKRELGPLKQHYSELDNNIDSVVKEIDKNNETFKRIHGIIYKGDWTDELLKQWDDFNKTDRGMQELNARYAVLSEERFVISKKIGDLESAPDALELGNGFIIASDGRTQIGNNGDNYGVMGRVKISLGKDERGNYLSYYDIWNLEKSQVEGEKGFLGKSFEIYDRIYYDVETFKVIK